MLLEFPIVLDVGIQAKGFAHYTFRIDLFEFKLIGPDGPLDGIGEISDPVAIDQQRGVPKKKDILGDDILGEDALHGVSVLGDVLLFQSGGHDAHNHETEPYVRKGGGSLPGVSAEGGDEIIGIGGYGEPGTPHEKMVCPSLIIEPKPGDPGQDGG